MKYSSWLLYLNVFIFLFFIIEIKHYSTSEINMCRVYLHQASMGKSSKKIGKIHNYPSFWKVTKLVARALVAIRRKKKLVKPQHWHFCIILKRSNNIKAVKTGVTLKVLCYWQSQISELLRSVLEILSFWNKFWILCLLW